MGYLNAQVHNTCLTFDKLPDGVPTTDLGGGVIRLDSGPNVGRLVRHNGEKFTEVVETTNPTTGLKEFVAPVIVSQRNGAAFERALIEAANDITGNVSKNGEILTTTLPDERVVRTIPDIFGVGGGLADAKNVISAAATKQLRGQIMIADERGAPFTLVISPRTERVSGPLRELIDGLRIDGKPSGTISVFDPATGSFTEAVFDSAGNVVRGAP